MTKRHGLKECRGCGTYFIPKRPGQVYHDGPCRKAHYSRMYGSPQTTIACLNCGSLVDTTAPKKQKYCNKDCRREARKKRSDELKARLIAEKQTYTGEVIDALYRDNFSCTKCGRDKSKVKLVVVPDEEKLRTLCITCANEKS